MGLWTTAGGTASTAMGVAIEVSGDYSFGFGGDPESQGVDISDDHVFVIHGANVGMGNTGPDYLLEMEESGGGYYSASDHQWHNGSSKDIKQDIVPSDIDVSKVLESVKIVKYRYKTEAAKDENAPYHIGFIGEETTPLLSGKDQNSMATGDCIGLLLAAVKEQQETIETLNARLELLEKKLVELEIRD